MLGTWDTGCDVPDMSEVILHDAHCVLERGTGMLINIAIYLVSGIVHFDWGKWLSLPEPVESEQQN